MQLIDDLGDLVVESLDYINRILINNIILYIKKL